MALRPNIYIPAFKRISGFEKLFLFGSFQSITICASVTQALNIQYVYGILLLENMFIDI